MTGAGLVRVRPATADDGPALRALEVRAGARFADVGMDDVAADEPASVEQLTGYAADGRSAVAIDGTDAIVGYVLVDRVDGAAHVEQISVDPDHQGRGVGRLLLAWVDDWARGEGYRAVTLTTFRDVPWNAPLYARLGFVEVPAGERSPAHLGVVEAERLRGLPVGRRVLMRRPLATGTTTA